MEHSQCAAYGRVEEVTLGVLDVHYVGRCDMQHVIASSNCQVEGPRVEEIGLNQFEPLLCTRERCEMALPFGSAHVAGGALHRISGLEQQTNGFGSDESGGSVTKTGCSLSSAVMRAVKLPAQGESMLACLGSLF